MAVLTSPAALPLLGRTAQDDLYDLCRRAVEAAARRRTPTLLSWAARLRHIDVTRAWDHGRAHTDRSLLWQSAWDRGTMVALGSAHDLRDSGDARVPGVRRRWAELTRDAVLGGHAGAGLPTGQGPLLVGGFSFMAREASPGPFPEALMWVPALQLRGGDGLAELRLNAVVRAGDDPELIAAELAGRAERWLPAPTGDAPPADEVRTLAVQENPTPEQWKDRVRRATDRIRAGAFEKVVLAREVRVSADRAFQPAPALRRLRRAYPDATVFAVADAEHTFIGATPEYLVRLSGETVRALGLAGSAPRGSTDPLDARLERELLDSPKIRHEHEVVVRALIDTLSRSCADVGTGDGAHVLKLANVQHVATVVDGRGIRPGLGVLDFVETLHPTPALGGHPRTPSLDWLAGNEGLDRGWYAGTVGWTDATGQGEFAVAIRCALLRANVASLYAGCGIVADSDPEAEYQETLIKLRPMRQALGLDT